MALPTSPSTETSSVPDHILNGPRLLGHPRGLFLLFMVEMWERFSYYGMQLRPARALLFLCSSVHHKQPSRAAEDVIETSQSATAGASCGPRVYIGCFVPTHLPLL